MYRQTPCDLASSLGYEQCVQFLRSHSCPTGNCFIKCFYCFSNKTALIELIRIVFLLSPVSVLTCFQNILLVSSQRKSKRLLDDGGYTDQVKRPRNG